MDCPFCAAVNRAGAAWCGQCHQLFPAPPPTPEELALEEFRKRRRAEGLKGALGQTASVTLEPEPGGGLVFVEPGGERRATVVTHGDHHLVVDLDDRLLFTVEPYRAVDRGAYAVFDEKEHPLAVFLRVGRTAEVRDGTGAPVAVIELEGDRLDIVETGRHLVGFVFHHERHLGSVVDDTWGLAVFEEPHVLDRRALAAAPLVCRLLSGRRPRPKAPARAGFSFEAVGAVEVGSMMTGALRIFFR